MEETKGERRVPKWAALEEIEKDRTRVALNKDRVRSITQKLSKLQQGLEVDKNRSRSAFENRLNEFEIQIKKLEEDELSRFEECDQQLEQIVEALGQERLSRELLDERKTKEGEVIMKTVDLKMEQMKGDIQMTSQQQNKDILVLQEQLETERTLRIQAEEKFGGQLSDQVSKLMEQVGSFQNSIEQVSKRVQELESENVSLKDQIKHEKQGRLELESHFLGLMEDLCAKMRNEMLNERNDREAMEETMLKLIEETCTRVEGGLISN